MGKARASQRPDRSRGLLRKFTGSLTGVQPSRSQHAAPLVEPWS